MTCERCGAQTEPGIVLVGSQVAWHTKASFFLEGSQAFREAVGKGNYFFSPVQLEADRCRSCGWVYIRPLSGCVHDRESGFIFPRSALRWWAGSESFQASPWYLFTGKNRSGVQAERLAGGGMLLSVVNARTAAARCSKCGSIAFQGRLASRKS